MFTKETFIIEMTGIWAAGYISKLFVPLTELLRTKYDRVDDSGERNRITTRYHIDNTAALYENKAARNRVNELIIRINRGETLSPKEEQELVHFLTESERRFLHDVEAFAMPVDIVFRRGGRLQDYILCYNALDIIGKITRDIRSQPKLQFFLKADLDIIKRTYEHKHVQSMIVENPNVYNSTPEKAYEQQEKWLQRIERFAGLRYIERKHVEKEQFAQQIVEEILDGLKYFRFKIVHKGPDIFLCHASEDKETFVRPLVKALAEFGVRVWYDEFELKVGDSLNESINRGLAASRYGVVVLSKAFFNKNWTQRELGGLVARETNEKKVILPIWHGITKNELLALSPTLADKVAIDSSNKSIKEIAEILKDEIYQ